MKTAIVYYSLTGNVDLAAKQVGEILEADLVRIAPEAAYPDRGFRKYFWGGKSAVMEDTPVLQPYELDWEQYDTVILGTPIWASNIAPPLRTFVRDNLERLRARRVGFLGCFSGGGDGKAVAKLKMLLETDDLAAVLVLSDPKDRPKPEHQAQIETFCAALENSR